VSQQVTIWLIFFLAVWSLGCCRQDIDYEDDKKGNRVWIRRVRTQANPVSYGNHVFNRIEHTLLLANFLSLEGNQDLKVSDSSDKKYWKKPEFEKPGETNTMAHLIGMNVPEEYFHLVNGGGHDDKQTRRNKLISLLGAGDTLSDIYQQQNGGMDIQVRKFINDLQYDHRGRQRSAKERQNFLQTKKVDEFLKGIVEDSVKKDIRKGQQLNKHVGDLLKLVEQAENKMKERAKDRSKTINDAKFTGNFQSKLQKRTLNGLGEGVDVAIRERHLVGREAGMYALLLDESEIVTGKKGEKKKWDNIETRLLTLDGQKDAAGNHKPVVKEPRYSVSTTCNGQRKKRSIFDNILDGFEEMEHKTNVSIEHWRGVRHVRKRRESRGAGCSCGCRQKLKRAMTSPPNVYAESISSQVSDLTSTVDSADLKPKSPGKKFLKSMKKVMSALGSICQVVDGVMAVFEIIQIFLPASDSAELAYMKVQFDIVGSKLDSVLGGQNEIKAGIELLQKTKDIDPGLIFSLDKGKENFLDSIKSADGQLGVQSERELEYLIKRIQGRDMQAMLNKLLWTITDPGKSVFSDRENIMRVYLRKKGNDCREATSFGFRLMNLIRRARSVVMFHNLVQKVSDTDINYEDNLQKALMVVYEESRNCLNGSNTHAHLDLKTKHRDSSLDDVKENFEEKYYVHDWAVLRYDTANVEVDDNSFRYFHSKTPAQKKYIRDKEGKKTTVAAYRPHSKKPKDGEKTKFIAHFKIWARRYCNRYGKKTHLKTSAYRVFREIHKLPYQNMIRTMIIVYDHYKPHAQANGFDIEEICEVRVVEAPFSDNYSQYKILIQLESQYLPDPEPCDEKGGTSLVIDQDDGNEAFCVCKRDYTGLDCSNRTAVSASNLLNSEDNKLWLGHLRVPGMFDLMDEVQKTRDKISKEIAQSTNVTIGAIADAVDTLQEGQEGIVDSITSAVDTIQDKIGESTITITDGQRESTIKLSKEHATSRVFIKDLLDNYQSDLGFQFNGLRQGLQESFDSWELAYKQDTDSILQELHSLNDDVQSGLNNVLCQGRELDFYRPIRELRNVLTGIYHVGGEEEQKEKMDNFVDNGLWDFKKRLKPELKRALEGDQSLTTPSDSMTELRMKCDFEKKEYCTDSYHSKLQKQGKDLMKMYYEMRQLEKVLGERNYDQIVAHERWQEVTLKELELIERRREAASCPGYHNLDLVGSGCQNFSTYQGQTITLHCKRQGHSTVLIDYGQTGVNNITPDHNLEITDLMKRNAQALISKIFFQGGEEDDLQTILKYVIKEGLPVNFNGYGNMTTLMAITANGRTEIVKQLLSLGANPLSKDYSQEKSYDVAIKRNKSEIADFLESLSDTPMTLSEMERHRRHILIHVLGGPWSSMNTKERVAHNRFKKWTVMPQVKCQYDGTGNSWDVNPNNIYCVRDCTGVDDASGKPYVIGIGEERTLGEKPGYRWVDSDGNPISSVQCLVRDIGGYEVTGSEGFHELADIDECAENAELCKPLGECINTLESYTCECNHGEVKDDGEHTTCINNLSFDLRDSQKGDMITYRVKCLGNCESIRATVNVDQGDADLFASEDETLQMEDSDCLNCPMCKARSIGRKDECSSMGPIKSDSFFLTVFAAEAFTNGRLAITGINVKNASIPVSFLVIGGESGRFKRSGKWKSSEPSDTVELLDFESGTGSRRLLGKFPMKISKAVGATLSKFSIH